MKRFALFITFAMATLPWSFGQISATSRASTAGQAATSSAQGSAARNASMKYTGGVSTTRRLKHGRAHMRHNIPTSTGSAYRSSTAAMQSAKK